MNNLRSCGTYKLERGIPEIWECPLALVLVTHQNGKSTRLVKLWTASYSMERKFDRRRA